MELELKNVLDTIDGGVKTVAAEVKSVATRVDTIDASQKAMQKQTDDIDRQLATRMTGSVITGSAIRKTMDESDGMNRLLKEKHGSGAVLLKGAAYDEFMRKTTMTEAANGFQTTGVLQIDRIPGITPEARQTLTVRDLLPSRPTTMAVVDFVRVSTPMTIGSPVPEASTKPENQLVFNSLSEKVRTLATWIPASKQILDDMQELMGFIQTSLPYYVNLAEELELLAGDSTGEHLHGLLPQASIFNTASLPAGSTKIDTIGAVIGSIQTAKELPPTFAIVHPADWWSMRLSKDTLGRYLIGDPSQTAAARLFDLDVVATTSISKGTFLIGNGTPTGVEIRDRMEMQVEISTEHSTFFVQNLVAIRAEKRLALIVKRPQSFVTGTYPAGS